MTVVVANGGRAGQSARASAPGRQVLARREFPLDLSPGEKGMFIGAGPSSVRAGHWWQNHTKRGPEMRGHYTSPRRESASEKGGQRVGPAGGDLRRDPPRRTRTAPWREPAHSGPSLGPSLGLRRARLHTPLGNAQAGPGPRPGSFSSPGLRPPPSLASDVPRLASVRSDAGGTRTRRPSSPPISTNSTALSETHSDSEPRSSGLGIAVGWLSPGEPSRHPRGAIAPAPGGGGG